MDNEGRPYTLFALYSDGSPMLLDSLRDTCQTYSRASKAIEDIASSIEWLKNMWHVFRRDSEPLILHCKLSPGFAFVLLLRASHGNRTSRGSVLKRIGKQVC